MFEEGQIIPEARIALDRQKENVRRGKEMHEKEVSKLKDELKEDTARGIFSMTRTERQMRGLPMLSTGTGGAKSWKRKRSEWNSKCCNKEARLYRSVSYGHGNREDSYRCQKCWSDCEVVPRPKRARTPVPRRQRK